MKLAIVGLGPRGLAGLERLMHNLVYDRIKKQVNVIIFEPSVYLGAGTVWSPDQSSANWINISLRALEQLAGRETLIYNNLRIPSFPKFTHWLDQEYKISTTGEIDKFPQRSLMGEYLHKRFISIYTALESVGMIEIYKEKVTEIHLEDDEVQLKTAKNKFTCDQCLITVGHQETALDDQLKSWKKHAKVNNCDLYIEAYSDAIEREICCDDKVGLRGFGLGMIDIVRLLTIGNNASFVKQESSIFLDYVGSDTSIKKLIPFSLDGLAPVPKPKNKQVDSQFMPSDDMILRFEKEIIVALESAETIQSYNFLIDAFASIATELFALHNSLNNRELHEVSAIWLQSPSSNHTAFLDKKMPMVEYMINTCFFASGKKEPSIDYCLGQLWRHLQPSLYRIFAHCELNEKVMTDIIQLDGGTKRYSFGPPLESILQLIALAEAKILDLSVLDDPTIDCVSEGWKLTKGNHLSSCNVMINTVLSPPKIEEISEGLICQLVDEENIAIVSENLGIKTEKDARIITDNDSEQDKLTLLGRNSKGSVLGVDAILECFGPQVDDWAKGICERM